MEKRKAVRRWGSQIMAVIMIILSVSQNPQMILAAVKSIVEYGNTVLETKDVSNAMYLGEVFDLGGDKYVGYVVDNYDYYFATSDDLVHWDVQAKYFTLVYGNGVFVGIKDGVLQYTKDGSLWQEAALSGGVSPYGLRFENSAFKLYYEKGQETGVMISKDAKTWYDVTNDLPENAEPAQFLVLGEDKYVALQNTKNGASGLSVSTTNRIDDTDTQWTEIQTLKKEGYGYWSNYFFNGKTVGLHMYLTDSFDERKSSYNAGNDIYCITTDFVNWEEKSWEEYQEICGYDYYRTGEMESTESFDAAPDHKVFDGVEVLPYVVGDEVHCASYVVYYENGERKRALAEIRYNGKVDSFVPTGEPFKDMQDHTWAAEAVAFAAGRKYLSSNWDGSFWPKKEATRIEFLAAVMKTLEVKRPDTPPAGFTPFEDIWFGGEDGYHVNTAKMLGMVSGVGDNRYDPDATITREDMMTITCNVLSKLGKLTPDETLAGIAPYTDKDAVSAYAKPAISALIKAGVVSGDGVSLHPKNNISRAEVAIILYRIRYL